MNNNFYISHFILSWDEYSLLIKIEKKQQNLNVIKIPDSFYPSPSMKLKDLEIYSMKAANSP